jgi:hypothetical protein
MWHEAGSPLCPRPHPRRHPYAELGTRLPAAPLGESYVKALKEREGEEKSVTGESREKLRRLL